MSEFEERIRRVAEKKQAVDAEAELARRAQEREEAEKEAEWRRKAAAATRRREELDGAIRAVTEALLRRYPVESGQAPPDCELVLTSEAQRELESIPRHKTQHVMGQASQPWFGIPNAVNAMRRRSAERGSHVRAWRLSCEISAADGWRAQLRITEEGAIVRVRSVASVTRDGSPASPILQRFDFDLDRASWSEANCDLIQDGLANLVIEHDLRLAT